MSLDVCCSTGCSLLSSAARGVLVVSVVPITATVDKIVNSNNRMGFSELIIRSGLLLAGAAGVNSVVHAIVPLTDTMLDPTISGGAIGLAFGIVCAINDIREENISVKEVVKICSVTPLVGAGINNVISWILC